MDHLEAIVEIKNVLDPVLCKQVMSLTDKKSNKKLQIGTGSPGYGLLNTEIRDVCGYHLNSATPTNMFYWNFIKKEIERLYIFYKGKFPKMASNKISQIDLLKYKSGGTYKVHTDHYTGAPRCLSIIMNLNDNYEGGDLVFTDQKEVEIKRIKLAKRSIVFFPSNFLYPHTIEPITKGYRYSIVSWLQ